MTDDSMEERTPAFDIGKFRETASEAGYAITDVKYVDPDEPMEFREFIQRLNDGDMTLSEIKAGIQNISFNIEIKLTYVGEAYKLLSDLLHPYPTIETKE